MVTISPTAESKLHRFQDYPIAHWVDEDLYNSVRRRYHAIFSGESQDDKLLGPPVHDPEPPVHTD